MNELEINILNYIKNHGSFERPVPLKLLKAEFDISERSVKDTVERLRCEFKQPIIGFRKIAYWTREEVYNHAKRFSKSFNNGPWKTDFDAMAKKTLLKSIIGTYGPKSVDMQKAIVADNENEDEKAAPIDVTPQEESLSDLIGEAPQEELPIANPETGEIQEEQTALFDQLGDLTND